MHSPIGAAQSSGVAVDADRLQAAGIRTVAGRHLTLHTDLPPSPAVDELPQVFDAALAQWAAYFEVDPASLDAWRMQGFLMRDAARFRIAGLLPQHVPSFKNGYCHYPDLWLFDQSNDYNRRHLLLHEGTHGFMTSQFGGVGATWYAEGMAELLATHRWTDGRLTLGIMPRNRDEVPDLGRVKLVRDAVAAGRRATLDELLNTVPSAHLPNETYAWCWALTTLLDGTPSYRPRFRELRKHAADARFNERFHAAFANDLPVLRRQWLVFTDGLEFGDEPARSVVDFAPGTALPPSGGRAIVAAERGWQSTGLRLEAGKSYRLSASGRYRIAVSTDPAGNAAAWPCEPGGVSIRYYRGRPLGLLLGAVEPDVPTPGASPALLAPQPVGLGTTLVPTTTGTLYLRVNDSDGELADNAGTLTVEVAETR